MCGCKDHVGFGTFGNSNQNRTITKTCLGQIQEIDNCILDELKDLWYLGIITYASCCGHNKINGSIIVSPRYITQMKLLGYIESDKLDWFYPKSIPITNKFN